jgi:hypothetical protein
MASKEQTIRKLAVVGTRDITLIITETLEIIRNASSQNVIIAAYKIRLLTIYSLKKQEEKKYQ